MTPSMLSRAGKNRVDWPQEPKALWDPDSGPRSTTVLHHIGSWAVTHPVSVVWDGVEVGVSSRSAMEKLALLSVSQNERYRKGRAGEKRDRKNERVREGW